MFSYFCFGCTIKDSDESYDVLLICDESNDEGLLWFCDDEMLLSLPKSNIKKSFVFSRSKSSVFSDDGGWKWFGGGDNWKWFDGDGGWK